MRYHVTLSTRGLGYVTYDVDAATEEDAKAKAAALFLRKRSHLGMADFTIAKVVETGVSSPRKRRLRRKASPAGQRVPPGADAASAP